MGASEGELTELTVEAVQNVQRNLDNEGSESAPVEQQTPPAEAPAEYKLSGPAQALFDQVPENERAIVAKYISELDKTHQQGFTKYAQDVQGKIRQYEQYGDPEVLRVAAATYHTLLSDPQAIYDWMVLPKSEGGGGFTPRQAAQQIAEAEGNGEFDDDPRLKQLMEKQSTSEKLLTGIASWIQQQEQASKLEADKQWYFQTLDEAQKTHGKIPEEHMDLVHRLVGAGNITPAEAVAEYHRIRQSGINEARTKPPAILGGGGTPRPPSNLEEMSDEERLKYMASRVMEINNSQR